MLAKTVRAGNPQLSNDTTIEKLGELGITRDQSSRWQLVARVSEKDFQKWMADEMRAKKILTFNGLYKFAQSLFPSGVWAGQDEGWAY